ncbi:MAG: hypothetical protein IJ822_10645, partial [Pyramidobacter sp.]|nr:hypothetical protein [Pyramidobacter sp.]
MRGVPHLFAKATVVYCVALATLASLYSLYKQGQGFSMGEVLAIVLGFFGGELLLLCLKTVLKKETKGEGYEDPTE